MTGNEVASAFGVHTEPTSAATSGPPTLDASVVYAALRRAGIRSPSQEQLRLETLAGGVSNDVVAVTGPGVDVVLKRALPRLRVAAEWRAAPTRVFTEAEALKMASHVLPGLVPRVLGVDEQDYLLVIERAPREYIEWRTSLLAGHIESAVAEALGRHLATWHRSTSGTDVSYEGFEDTEPFRQLRIEPFYGAIAERHPDLTGPIGAVVDRMLASRVCLVHGDFSPKNVLYGTEGMWIIDWEVAHRGDPTFDLAFMLAHLVCKSLHRPTDRARLRAAADAFLAGYGWDTDLPEYDDSYLVSQVACLVLARIDGKSPAAYLDERARDRGRRLASALLRQTEPSYAGLWRALDSDDTA